MIILIIYTIGLGKPILFGVCKISAQSGIIFVGRINAFNIAGIIIRKDIAIIRIFAGSRQGRKPYVHGIGQIGRVR